MVKVRYALGAVVVALAAAAGVWRIQRDEAALPPGFALANGRAEATEIDIATKRAGRISEVLVDEGDAVEAGQVLARMDVRDLRAALTQARAEQKRAEEDRRYADAQIAQADSELDFANQQFVRSQSLAGSGNVPRERVDADRNRKQVAEAGLRAAKIRRIEADAAVESAAARVQQISVDIEDSELRTPRGGRVQYRLAEPGEVLAAGGRVLTVIDLDDTWMTLFLPEAEAGRLAIGAEARIVLDAFPDRPVPAKITFVAAQAQFTPKTVETRDERQKLSFRVKAQVDVPAKYRPLAKPGLPGVAWVRLDPSAEWPTWLQPKPE